MPDYEKMYKTLFKAVTDAINILQEAQEEAEEQYIEAELPVVKILPCINRPNPPTLFQSTGDKRGECMYRVAILEPPDGKITAMLCDRLLAWGGSPSVVLRQASQLSDLGGAYDLLVVFASASDCATSPPSSDLSCHVLLLPGEAQEAIWKQIPSGCVVSFGLSPKDSITVSSIEPSSAVLALQRELVTLGGRVIEQQEIPLSIPKATSARDVTVLASGLLLLGIPPERLAV